MRQQRNKLDCRLSEAVDRLLLVRQIVLPGQQPPTHETPQPVSQDVGGNAFLRIIQKFTEMPAITEHDVADNN